MATVIGSVDLSRTFAGGLLYKRNVDPTAKCPAFVRQVVTVESIVNGEESLVEPVIEEIDLDEEESEVMGKPS
jgi:hypothetical protein